MTPGMQIRLWYRRATPRQRQSTVGAIAVVVALLIASVAFAPGSGNRSHRVVTSANGQAGDGAVEGGVPGGAAGSAGTSPEAAAPRR